MTKWNNVDQHTTDLAAYEKRMEAESMEDMWVESRIIQLLKEGMSEASAEKQAQYEWYSRTDVE